VFDLIGVNIDISRLEYDANSLNIAVTESKTNIETNTRNIETINGRVTVLKDKLDYTSVINDINDSINSFRNR
jgi:hypothetical protein